VTALVAIAFLVPLTVIVGSTVRQRVVASAFQSASAIGPILVVTTEPGDIRRVVASTGPGAAGRMAVFLPGAFTGAVPDDSGPDVIGKVTVPAADVAQASRTRRSFTASVAGGVAVLQPVLLDSDRVAVVAVQVPDAELDRGVLRARLILVALALALVAGSVAVADRLAARVVRSAGDLSRAAAKLGAGDLSVRITPEGPAELQEAATAFNLMAARVRSLLDAERELSADLSHRLRTPMTALLLSSRAVEDGEVGEQVRASVRQLEEEITQIIQRTRASDHPPVRCEDPIGVLRERLEFWGNLAEDENRLWTLRAPDAVPALALSGEDLAAAADVLIGNIFAHTPPGRSFTVGVSDAPEALEVTVDDAGLGIADPQRALRRGASGAGSTGLGLDIARRLAESTGGTLRIGSSPMGGARVELILRRLPKQPEQRRRRTRRQIR
jgi:signal transduction histidine kinase